MMYRIEGKYSYYVEGHGHGEEVLKDEFNLPDDATAISSFKARMGHITRSFDYARDFELEAKLYDGNGAEISSFPPKGKTARFAV